MDVESRLGFPFHTTSGRCRGCGTRVDLKWGQETPCPSCGERLAACGQCGEPMAAAGLAYRDLSGKQWLCEEHASEEAWEDARIAEFGSPAANTTLSETPRAVAARRLYEERVGEVRRRGGNVREELFPYGAELPVHALPAPVVEAYRFFERAVMDRDFGSVGIWRWELDVQPLHVVRCGTDGSDGWVELYDADGTPLGYARTDWDCPVWKPYGLTRRGAFGDEAPGMREELAEAVSRLRGQ